jgi:hypothetical protein
MFYTYLWLREDGTPYYAGKGIGNRAFIKDSHRVPPPKDKERIIIQEFECEVDAFLAEKFLIAYYGRKDLKTGCLINRTEGGTGGAHPVSKITKAKQSQSALGKNTWSEGNKNACGRRDEIQCHVMSEAVKEKNITDPSRKWRQHHTRWHVKRNIINLECTLCLTN